jgi:ADP-ribosyl-[dinitrogen reductase] hydrolase
MGYRHSGRSETDARRLIPDQPTGLALVTDTSIDYRDRYRGAMIGTAIGDALGRPAEGLSPRNIDEAHGYLTDFVPQRGWDGGPTGTLTDDTEMALCVAQSFAECAGVDPDDLANRFRAWGRVGRGMGSATRAACRRISDGQEWYDSGSESAGNGAAMRAAPIGLLHPFDGDALRGTAAITAVITHNDPTAVAATIVMAYTVAFLLHTANGTFDPDALLTGIDQVMTGVEDPALQERSDSQAVTTLLARIPDVFAMRGRPIEEIYAFTHNGAFVLESLPAALAAFLSSPEDPEQVVTAAVNGGYDADTVGAMAGAFAGAYHGASGFPERWVSNIEFRSGLEGAADELLTLSGTGPQPVRSQHPKPDEYAPFEADDKRWITRTHHDAAKRQPDEAYDIRVMPHPAAARSLVR